jgi:protein-disulfide isomerase
MSVEKKNKREEQRQRAQARDRQRRLRMMSFIGVGAALIVFAVVWQQIKPITGIVAPEIEAAPFANGNSMGDPNAPIQIVEYSDFQCPFCERFFNETEPLLVEYFIKTGKVYFTYRSAGNFVSDNLGGARTESQDAAAAAYCAADQGKFWQMHAAIFANNLDVENKGALSSRRLAAMAEAVGLDMTAYNDCYNSGKYKDRVQQDAEDFAIAAGNESRGTPFFVITYTVNGETKTEVINGAQPIGEFQRIIEAALLVADK